MTRTLAVVFMLCSSALQAQQRQPLVGVWHIGYPVGMRLENGVAEPIMATGTLTIAARGDSLVGELVTDSTPGLPRHAPTHLLGRPGVGEAVFTSSSKVTVNVNGNRSQGTAVSTWTLRASGDTLSGSVERKLEGVEAPPQEPGRVTGTRRKP
jgi:hypothetical protein